MGFTPNRCVLIDTNLLVLLVVGATDHKLIERIKPTKGYTAGDYELAASIAAKFRYAFTTPHVLTETSNLLHRVAWGAAEAALAQTLRAIQSRLDERHVPSHRLSRDAAFARLGLTDVAVLDLSRRGCTIFSNDLELCVAAQSRRFEVLNFEHVRFAATSVPQSE